jgi:thiol-disulfide isomerase/thioredoxin
MWAAVLGVTGLVVGLSILKGRTGVTGLEGKKPPAVTLKLLDGNKQVELPDKAGRVTMIDFWATWCAPCRRSMPEVQRIWKEYKGRGVELIAVNTDLPSANLDPSIREFLMQGGLSLTVALDGERQLAQSAYAVAALPTLVVLDKTGRVAFSQEGLVVGAVESRLRASLDAALAARDMDVRNSN